MKGFDKSMVVAAGLAAALSLGMVGCANGGNASAGSTEQAGSGTTTATSGESVSGEEAKIAYANTHFGFAYQTPEGFTQTIKDSGSDSAELVYYSSNEAGAEVYILGYTGLTELEGVTDEASWAKYYTQMQTAQMQAQGETDIVVKSGSATVGDGTKMTAIRLDSKKDDKAIYREIFMTLDSEGSGMTILFITDNEETLQLMESGIGSYLV
ncbi:MAG: hypothetical protein Q4B54_05180 [Coriobacteriales bacterium]|nr:hypothetical protein [Coriobacteriales bacterium]